MFTQRFVEISYQKNTNIRWKGFLSMSDRIVVSPLLEQLLVGVWW
jgi:hypothetical protein